MATSAPNNTELLCSLLVSPSHWVFCHFRCLCWTGFLSCPYTFLQWKEYGKKGPLWHSLLEVWLFVLNAFSFWSHFSPSAFGSNVGFSSIKCCDKKKKREKSRCGNNLIQSFYCGPNEMISLCVVMQKNWRSRGWRKWTNMPREVENRLTTLIYAVYQVHYQTTVYSKSRYFIVGYFSPSTNFS